MQIRIRLPVSAGERIARFVGASPKYWKPFSEIAFALCSYPKGALKLMIQTQTLAYGLGRTSCKYFFGQPQLSETLFRFLFGVLFVSARRPKAHNANTNACLLARADELQGLSGQPNILETLLRNCF